MKAFCTLSFLLILQIGWSQTKVSISDGDWNNPLIWNPASVPNLTDDTLIINHVIDFSGILQVTANHVIIGVNGVLSGVETLSIDRNLLVDGQLIVDTVVTGGAGGEYFINNGYIESTQFTPTNLMNTNNGSMNLLGVFICTEPFLNTTAGSLETMDLVTTSNANFENNGAISVENWTSEGTVFGTGSFCIESCFQNFGNITGTLTVCDGTPNSGLPCDLNIGIIAPTVTICTAGPCSSTSGLIDASNNFDLTLFPNPSSDGHLTLETDAVILSIKVIDLMGRCLVEKFLGDLHVIDLSFLENGEYLIRIETAQGVLLKRIIKAN